MPEKPTIFISCGQFTSEERKLGSDCCKLVEELTGCRAYFADNQTSLQGLTTNILSELDRAAGLVVVMHRRGAVTFPNGSTLTRASVWIEQEIAIAAFLSQVLNRELRVTAYIHEDIALEGMRDKLQLNPIRFKNNCEVLEHLRKLLPTWDLLPFEKTSDIQLSISYEKAKITQERHDYLLMVTVTNKGTTRLDDYQLDVEVPNAFLDQTTIYALEVKDRRTSTHRLLRTTHSNWREPIYLGDSKTLLKLPYFVDSHRFYATNDHLDDIVKATFYAGSSKPLVVEKKMRDLQVF